MKLALTLEADSINAQTLNMGRIVVDVDGVNLTELINKVAENGYSLRVVDDSDQQSTCTPPPLTTLTGIRCSTAHITETDNAWLYSLSHQTSDFGESEWIHFTGSGYLLRTDAAYSALFDHGLASKSDQRFASIRSTGNLTFSTAF